MPAYRIEFQVLVFTKDGHISPQRIEDSIVELIREHEAFGYVTNVYVTRSEEENETED